VTRRERPGGPRNQSAVFPRQGSDRETPVGWPGQGNFFACVASRQSPVCDAETGHRSVSVCHLGGIALKLGRKLTWDVALEEFPGDREANTYLAREQRKPWTYDIT